MSDDGRRWSTDRRRERQRSTAAGEGRHWDAETPRPNVKSSSRQLRRTERHRARLHVLCRGSCIAAVLQGSQPGEFEVGLESIDAGNGFHLHLLHLSMVGAGPIVVGCRCGERHQLDPQQLREEAWHGRPGRPRSVSVSSVCSPPSTL